MTLYKPNILCERVHYGRRVHIHIAFEELDGQQIVVQPVQMQNLVEGEIHPPAMELTLDGAQAFADALWAAGFRPTQGQQSEGQMGATTKHLDDMRALVAALSKVELPK